MSIAMATNLAPQMACRQIVAEDRQAVIDLLVRGFQERGSAYWAHAFDVMSSRSAPEGFPRYGYVLTANEALVGIVLLIFSAPPGELYPRCNLSSWYVEDRYRPYASALVRKALAKRDVVYINISSVAHTRKTIVEQGFSCASEGVFLSIGALAEAPAGARIDEIDADDGPAGRQSTLLAEHSRAGCVSVTCTLDGQAHPFVFLRRKIPKTFIPCAQLIYCDDIANFVRFAGVLGRYLLKRGMPVFMLDANGPIEGLAGFYFAGRAHKYYRGPARPRLGDLSYTEAVLFGP
jgi:hypothetical protein